MSTSSTSTHKMQRGGLRNVAWGSALPLSMYSAMKSFSAIEAFSHAFWMEAPPPKQPGNACGVTTHSSSTHSMSAS